MIFENIKLALFSIKVNKMRSFLTMLGMIIGIGSVIAIVSLGDTMRSMFAQEYENIGTGLAGVYIMPEDGYFTENDYFKIEDREKFREAMGDDVTYVGFRYMDSAEARAGRKMENIYIETLAENPTAMEDLTIKHGRMLSDQDHYNKRKYVVMEQGTAMELFGVENAVGKTVNIKISGSEAEEYLIIGIYENTDSPLMKMMAGSGPKYAYVPEGALITEDSWNWSLYFMMDSDKDMAKKLNVTEATIRRQRFTFREKAKQAKFYLAMYELVFEDEPTTTEQIIPIHNNAIYVDDRYLITEDEKQHIVETFFSSIQPLVLKSFSPKEKKKVVILGKIAEQFEYGKKYSEQEVNEILKPIYADYMTIRRYLIMYGFMERTRDGRQYWLTN